MTGADGTCGVCGGPLPGTAGAHVCPVLPPRVRGDDPWRPWDEPAMRGAPTWREAWDRETRLMAAEILRNPIAYALIHIAENVFTEYEARIKQMGEPAE